MLNSSLLVAASLRDDPNAQRMALIRRIEAWLILPLAEARDACLGALSIEADARKLNDMLVLVRATLCRELDITAASGEERFAQLNTEYAANTLAPAPRASYEKLNVGFGLGIALIQKFPNLAKPPQPPADEVALRAQLDALYQRQLEDQKYTVPPLVTEARLVTMAALIVDYRTLLKSVTPGRQIHIDISFFAAHATYALARGWQQLQMRERAARCYADAAPLFRVGERPNDAAQSMQLARSLGYAERSDFDGASVLELRKLIDGGLDAFMRARAYARLADLSTDANSSFDALHYADQAAAEFASLGYLDLEAQDFDVALQSWIEACCRADALPAELKAVERINEVARLYLRLLSIRFASRTAQNSNAAANAETATQRLSAAMNDINRGVELAQRDVMTELAHYRP